VLAASTYPLEVVSLHRWLERNPGLEGQALQDAVAAQPWDPAVKALAPFRSVVATMNGELDWMQRLGDALLADEAAVMDAVQRLRRKAMEAGSLAENPATRVRFESEVVFIEPADPVLVRVPVYDVGVAYGPWWWPGYPPYAWGYPWYGPIDYYYGAWGFTAGVVLWGGWYHSHTHPDWHHRHLAHRRPGHPPARWTHNPVHRGGVPYVDRGVRDRHAGPDYRVRERQEFRGFDRWPAQRPPDGVRGTQGVRGPSPPTRPGPSALNPVARDSARAHAERGRESLRAPPAQRPPSTQGLPSAQGPESVQRPQSARTHPPKGRP
jgi:hypothetical protein